MNALPTPQEAASEHAERTHPRVGVGRLVARAVGGRTVLAEAHATSPLRFLQPGFHTKAAGVCLVTFGGGLIDGDAIDTLIEVEEGATLVVFTQASTKVFRGDASQSIRARVAGTLVFLPDPVAAFQDASYTQRVDVELRGPAAACVLLDGCTSGRAAFGERWAMQALDLRTTVTRDGRDVAVDALRLDAADGPIAERAGTFESFLTVLAVGCEPIARSILAPASPPTSHLAVAASPLARAAGGAVARIAASSPSRAIAEARARLRNLPDIDVMDPFAFRY